MPVMVPGIGVGNLSTRFRLFESKILQQQLLKYTNVYSSAGPQVWSCHNSQCRNVTWVSVTKIGAAEKYISSFLGVAGNLIWGRGGSSKMECTDLYPCHTYLFRSLYLYWTKCMLLKPKLQNKQIGLFHKRMWCSSHLLRPVDGSQTRTHFQIVT